MLKKMLGFIVFIFLLSCSKFHSNPPGWVPNAVFYQIFPERFYNGDRSNDPTLKSLEGSYPHDTESRWQVHPWTSDWYKLQPWEEENKKGFDFNAQRRRYGGDIQGVINKLDYLSDLGINAIYLNPIFHAPSLHKYDAAYYHHVDAYFGPDPEGDLIIMYSEDPGDPSTWQWTKSDMLFLSLIQKAHSKGIRIIIDGVFNHTGINFWAFRDLKEKGPLSAYKDWYTITSWDDPNTMKNEFQYKGWLGVRELPELKEDINGLVEPVKEHIFAIIRRWMDPNNDGNPDDGIDGWRLDVAEMVHHNFWKKFREEVKSINPQAYVTGEIFWDDWQNNKLMDPEPWLRGDEFDGIMNYRWASVITRFFIDNEIKITATEFVDHLVKMDTSYSSITRFQLLNLMDSHDTDRLSSNIVNPDNIYDKNVGVKDNPYYDVRKPRDDEWKIARLIILVQMTFPGPPMIYYGTESGMWGGDDPDERKPMIWREYTYEPEVANISKTERPVDVVAFDEGMHQYYKKCIRIRNDEEALRLGKMKFILTDNLKDVVAFERRYKQDYILVIINNSNEWQSARIDNMEGSWRNLWDESTIHPVKTDLEVLLDPKSALLLKRQ